MFHFKTCSHLPAIGVAAAALVTSAWAQPRLTMHKVVERGDPAPESEGLLFEMFGGHDIFAAPLSAPPNIGRQGNIAFHAFLGDDGVPDTSVGDRGIYSFIDGELRPVVMNDDPAPGTSGTFFGLISASPFLTGQGVSFRALIQDPPGIFTSGIWSDRFGDLELVMLDGDRLAGMPPGFGVRVFSFDSPDGESIIVDVQYDFSEAFEGFWRDRTGTMELIAIDGMQAPGLPEGVVFADSEPLLPLGPFGAWFPNRNGEVIFMSHIDGPGINVPEDRTNNEGIWAEGPDGLRLVVRESMPATSAGPDFVFGTELGWRSFSSDANIPSHLSDNGAALFGATIHDPVFSHWRSIWTDRKGKLECIAKGVKIPVGGDLPQADQAPGFPEGWDFSHFIFGFINNNHTVAFWGFVDNQTFPEDLTDPIDLGIWWDVGGTLSLVAGEKLAVGVDELADATFTFVGLSRLQEESDTLWYVGSFVGPGIDAANDFALFRVDPDGSQHIALREGDLVDVGGNGTDLRTVGIFAAGGGDHVSDAGDRVFEIFFNDGSHGIYTADVRPAGRLGDLNGDGIVGTGDMLIMFANWGPCPDPPDDCPADLNGDGTVGIADLLILFANWG